MRFQGASGRVGWDGGFLEDYMNLQLVHNSISPKIIIYGPYPVVKHATLLMSFRNYLAILQPNDKFPKMTQRGKERIAKELISKPIAYGRDP